MRRIKTAQSNKEDSISKSKKDGGEYYMEEYYYEYDDEADEVNN